MKSAIASHSVDLAAAESACVDIVVDDAPSSSSSSQRKGKRAQDDDDEQLLQSLQKRVHESGEILKGLTEPKPMTASVAFANYVRDSLVSMSKQKFRKARSRINSILSELMDDEESDEEQHPRAPTFAVPGPPPVRPLAPSSYTPTASELYQPPPHMWRHQPPPASVWASMEGQYVDHYMQQPLQQQQQPL